MTIERLYELLAEAEKKDNSILITMIEDEIREREYEREMERLIFQKKN